jgi:hypothetical protein
LVRIQRSLRRLAGIAERDGHRPRHLSGSAVGGDPACGRGDLGAAAERGLVGQYEHGAEQLPRYRPVRRWDGARRL